MLMLTRSAVVIAHGCAGLCCVLAASRLSAQTPLRYDREYPVIGYSSSPTQDAIARLQSQLDDGEKALEFESEHGYLASVLEALNIDPSSQVLVFSKTSLQGAFISPAEPRAIYFNDDVYVGWVQDADVIEVGSMDPHLGPVFYTLEQSVTDRPRFDRRNQQCLRCHDSYSLTGGGTPRFIMGSGYTGRQGQMVSHEGRILTDTRTPLRYRWGGWYVTGTHGKQLHLGNAVVVTGAEVRPENLPKTGNVTDLKPLTDIEFYLRPHSDIVALLVIEHQVEVQNLIARLNFLTLTASDDQDPIPAEKKSELESLADELTESLLMVGHPEFSSPIKGVSGFAESFSARGPHDAKGRSLRELDLQTRLFKYPLSYLVYSDAFDALPDMMKDYVWEQINRVLSGENPSDRYRHLSDEDRLAIREILDDTF